MHAWTRFKLAVKRRETPFHSRLHDLARALMGFSVPAIPGLHRFLYHEWATRTSVWHGFWRVVYYEPMFKSVCASVGKGFKLYYAGNGICRILGNLSVHLGDNVTLFDNAGLAGLRLFDNPELRVGSNCYIGPGMRISVAERVTIGEYCMMGNTMILDNAGHPADAGERCIPGGGLPDRHTVRPVAIGDFCIIYPHCCIYPGTRMGDGVVVKVGTHAKGTIPSFSMIEGNPCRIAKLLPIPEGLRERVGEERFAAWQRERQAYLEEHGEPRC